MVFSLNAYYVIFKVIPGDSRLKYMDNIGWYIDKNIKLIKLVTDFKNKYLYGFADYT